MRDTIDVLAESWRLWSGALAGDPDTRTLTGSRSLLPVGVIAVVAAYAGMLGRGAVLAVNRIRGLTRLLGLASTVAGMLLSQTVAALVLWAGARLVLDDTLGPVRVIALVLLATSPLVFDFLTAAPLVGPAIHWALRLWSFAVAWSVVADVYRLTAWASGALLLGSTLAAWALTRLVQPWLVRARAAVWLRITGRPLHLNADYLLRIGPTGPRRGAP